MVAPIPSLLAQTLDPARLEEVCGTNHTLTCRKVLEWTGSDAWANLADFAVGRPLRVALIVMLAWVLNHLARRAISRGIKTARDPDGVGKLARAGLNAGRTKAVTAGAPSLRAVQRVEAIGTVMRSGASTLIWGVALVTILGELGVSLGPLLASAGIAGIAFGFGAQSLVKDLLSGMFMLVEDQFGVGDIIDVGEASGVVEGITLRTTRIRDLEGTLWHFPNGEIHRVANKSQEWARALLDVGVGYSTDLALASAVIKDEADKMRLEPEWASVILEEPEIWGIEALGDSAITIRLVIKTKPGDQWRVRRQLNGRLKARFDAEGIEIPFPQRTVWHRPQPVAVDVPAVPAGTGPGAETAPGATTVAGEETAVTAKAEPDGAAPASGIPEGGRPGSVGPGSA